MSLALADALVAAAVMSFAVVNDVLGQWLFGPRACRVWLSADVMCSTASILNLCAISLDRYIHVRSPLHYYRLVTHRRSLAAIAIVWIMSALISFLPIHLGWHRVNGGVMATVVMPTSNVSASASAPSHVHSLVCHRLVIVMISGGFKGGTVGAIAPSPIGSYFFPKCRFFRVKGIHLVVCFCDK